LEEEKSSPKFLDREFKTFTTAFVFSDQKGVAHLEPAIISEMQSLVLDRKK
jgi:hypothetical protein